MAESRQSRIRADRQAALAGTLETYADLLGTMGLSVNSITQSYEALIPDESMKEIEKAMATLTRAQGCLFAARKHLWGLVEAQR